MGTTGAVRGLYEFDLTAFRAVHTGLRSPWLDPVFFLFTESGLTQAQAIFGLLYLRRPATKRWSGLILLGLFLAGTLGAQGLKRFVFPRERPSNLAFADPCWFEGTSLHGSPWLCERIYGNSFPSGHTSTSFALALLLTMLHPGNRRVAALAYGYAGMVGLSRVYAGVHWPTDVLGGACVGTLGGIAAWLLLGRWATEVRA